MGRPVPHLAIQEHATGSVAQEMHSESAYSVDRTTASTLSPSNPRKIQENFEDGNSQTLYATSVPVNESESGIRVISLKEAAREQFPFECPYCWGLQNIKSERSWK